jgi:hypothetical protein
MGHLAPACFLLRDGNLPPRALFEQERNPGQVEVNVFAGKQAKGGSRAVVKQDRTFGAAELEAIFADPLLQDSRNDRYRHDAGQHLIADRMFWAPLIALMTDARVGEIAQLTPTSMTGGPLLRAQVTRQSGCATVAMLSRTMSRRRSDLGAASRPTRPCQSWADRRKAAGHAMVIGIR